MGASAGGVTALKTVAAGLGADLPAAVFVVLHLPPTAQSSLPAILTRAGGMPATHAEDGEPIVHGRIYVAPPDSHLTLQEGAVRLERSARENGHRPAIDTLFRSAALAYGPKVMAVVLSGTLDDGALGSRAVRSVGGVTIVQDPTDAMYQEMPRSAIAINAPDHVAPVAEIPGLINGLVGTPVSRRLVGSAIDAMAIESAYFVSADEKPERVPEPWAPTDYVCPDCGGVLREVDDQGVLRFRCRVGHAYSIASLLERQGTALDTALWGAYRALAERAAIAHRVARRLKARGGTWGAQAFELRGNEFEEQAAQVRELIETLLPVPNPHAPDANAAATKAED